jgi:hypothetical protein
VNGRASGGRFVVSAELVVEIQLLRNQSDKIMIKVPDVIGFRDSVSFQQMGVNEMFNKLSGDRHGDVQEHRGSPDSEPG